MSHATKELMKSKSEKCAYIILKCACSEIIPCCRISLEETCAIQNKTFVIHVATSNMTDKIHEIFIAKKYNLCEKIKVHF